MLERLAIDAAKARDASHGCVECGAINDVTCREDDDIDKVSPPCVVGTTLNRRNDLFGKNHFEWIAEYMNRIANQTGEFYDARFGDYRIAKTDVNVKANVGRCDMCTDGQTHPCVEVIVANRPSLEWARRENSSILGG